MDRLRAITSFIHVVETRSFTVAARQLGLSRSHISKQIKELEDSLGVRLLTRTTKQVSPTEEGLAYHETCSRLLSELDNADVDLASRSREPRGLLRVLLPKSFTAGWLATAIQSFHQRYSDLELSISFHDQDADMIERGFDVAIRIGKKVTPSLIARQIGMMRYTLCAAPSYLAKHGTPRHPHDLTRHVCLRHLKNARDSQWRFEGPDGVVRAKVHGPFVSNSSMLLREWTLNGQGIALLPTFMIIQDLKENTLSVVLKNYGPAATPLFVLYPQRRHLPARVRLFVDFLISNLERLSNTSRQPTGGRRTVSPAAARKRSPTLEQLGGRGTRRD